MIQRAVMVRLDGGLGNQLFQYANGRALALQRGVGLLVDPCHLGHSGRDFGLTRFPIRASVIGRYRSNYVQRMRDSRGRRLFARMLGEPAWRFVKQGPRSFDPESIEPNGPVYLQGYFQSERYFSDCSEQIREELTLRDPSLEAIAIESAAAGPRLCVHIRRGDYVSNARYASIFGTCPMEYYERSIVAARKQFPDIRIWLFSDEPQWVERTMQIHAAELISGNPKLDLHDELWLMSKCSAHIIANSSLSWWGAWLANSAFVIAPRQWLKTAAYDTSDLVPSRWQRL